LLARVTALAVPRQEGPGLCGGLRVVVLGVGIFVFVVWGRLRPRRQPPHTEHHTRNAKHHTAEPPTTGHAPREAMLVLARRLTRSHGVLQSPRLAVAGTEELLEMNRREGWQVIQSTRRGRLV